MNPGARTAWSPASIRSRFSYTLLANVVRAILGATTGLLLARGLGPNAYGNMAFLLGTFLAVRQLLDMGSASAFFTFLSRRNRSRRFVRFYMGWLLLQFLLSLIVIGILFPERWVDLIWKGNDRLEVILAFIAVHLQMSVWPSVVQMCEAQRRTKWIQSLHIAVILTHLLVVGLLWRYSLLGIKVVFIAVAVEYLAASWLSMMRTRTTDCEEEIHGARDIFNMYLGYCAPLVPYAWASFAYEFADRWLLQTFGGSVQQAYYAVSSQIAALALLATTSLLNIFWKEVAEASENRNSLRIASLYWQAVRGLYFVAAACVGFAIPWSKEVLSLALGDQYTDSAMVFAIMLLYPLHQSVGQLASTMLYATGRVRMQSVLGIVFMMVSIIGSYLVLAPGHAPVPGLAWGAEGLAIKLVILQVIQVNILSFVVSRGIGVPFEWKFQITVLSGAVLSGWVSARIALLLTGESWPMLGCMALAGIIHAALIGMAGYKMPSLAGFSKQPTTR